jgi:hypothetical protein
VCGQRHALAALYLRETIPCTPWIEGWIGLYLVWTQRPRGKSFASAGNQTPDVQCAARHIFLFSFPSSVPQKLFISFALKFSGILHASVLAMNTFAH